MTATTDRMANMRRALIPALLCLSLGALTGCAGSGAQTDAERLAELTEQADTEQDRQIAEALGSLMEAFSEGPQLPDGWPEDKIPLPPGSRPVASLAETVIPGTGGAATGVFYDSLDSAGQLQSFFDAELPGAGWNILDSQITGNYLELSAEGHGFAAVFIGGTLPNTVRLQSGASISLQVLLTKPAE